MTGDGEFEPLVEGSTKPIAQTRRHAGIVVVKRYGFSRLELPSCVDRLIGLEKFRFPDLFSISN